MLKIQNLALSDYFYSFTVDTGGIQFTSSIETQNIRSGPGNSLTVSSPVGKLKLNGPQKVDFSSFAGPINIFGLEDITLKTKSQGKVCIFTIYVKSLFFTV